MSGYAEFLKRKAFTTPAVGLDVPDSAIHPSLFPFQRDVTRWAVRKGRAAIFADTGLGKTFMQLEWARLLGQRTLILAPLSVARQTVREAKKIGLAVTYARRQSEASSSLTITNYELLEHFDPALFGAVVLDESSILKAFDGKTRTKLIKAFGQVPYRLCCTATPAPNDIAEIGNHAEFLGLLTRGEMLASFFIHDAKSSAHAGWRLKGHAQPAFFRWLASWGMSIRKPSDLGYDDDGFVLPGLRITPLFVDSPPPEGNLFWTTNGIRGRLEARRGSIAQRLEAVVALVHGSSDQWILWCGLNDEGRLLARAIPGSALMEGQQSVEDKLGAIESFQDGKVRVLITKPKIAGFGMNFQNAHRMAFVGLSDSWETYYQCIRRCWRFGQRSPVDAAVVLSEAERPVWDNVMHKDREASAMREHLIGHVQEYECEEIGRVEAQTPYETNEAKDENWRMLLGDSVERLKEVADESVHLSVFSPPFLSLYTYTGTERDLGNSRTSHEFFEHFKFIIDDLFRATMPGRLCAVHVSQVPARLAYDGYMGIKDFRGDVIRAFEREKWIYHGEVCIDKDPQVQAVRSHAKQLLFVQLYKDSSWSVPAYADYVLIFRKPGDNPVPVVPDLSRESWIEWARPVWYGVRQSETLNAAEGREEDDERHVAALQLGVIERCVRLWTNPGELVLSPFAGIGSEGYMAVKLGRRFVGIELKRSYFEAACKNLRRAGVSDQVLLLARAVTEGRIPMGDRR